MSENINIDNIEKFINSSNILDNSHIGLIINKILEYKIEIKDKEAGKNIPYSIEDKISLNKISSTLKETIISSWALHYHSVEFTINNIAGTSSSEIIDEIYEFYKIKYMESLIELNLDINKEKSIKKKSTEVFIQINSKVKEIFTGRETSFSMEQLDIYVFAITVYVFYKCKVLLPIKEVL